MTESKVSAPDAARGGRGDTLAVTVTFPLGEAGPYRDEHDAATTAGSVRTAAMAHFGASEDPNLRFYLVHVGQEVADTTTIGEIAGHARAVKFTLARDVIQG